MPCSYDKRVDMINNVYMINSVCYINIADIYLTGEIEGRTRKWRAGKPRVERLARR